MSIPEKVLDGIDRLEPLPITVQKLLVALQDQSADFNEIAQTIEFDGAITANILRTANSAAFGGRVRIENTRDAVVRLGTITLLDIMLLGHLRTLKVASPLYNLSEDDLWLHGATASLAVKAIAKETRNRKIPEAATIAALIHDIGKLIMVRYLNTEPSVLGKQHEKRDLTSVEAETELFGCNHAEVGGAVARKWSFPEPITQAIEHHHETLPAEPNLMLDVVVLANLTAKIVAGGSGTAGMNHLADTAGLIDRVGLTADGCDRVCAETAVWMEELKQNYGLAK
ncbi:MAG: HDOD domain-containing protein [Acidobacteriia bacterium]|nr:HDOD domain-containing protein [Terriglobia bacterium]